MMKNVQKLDWEVKKYPMYYGNVKQFYSRSVVVGNLVFCSSMNAKDLETGKINTSTVKKQTTLCFEKVRLALEEAGSSINNIIKTFILVKNIPDIPLIREAELDYYQKHAPCLIEEPPVSVVIQPVSLEHSEALVEIEATAVINQDQPGWEVIKYPMYLGGIKQNYSRSVVVGNLVFLSGVAGVSTKIGRVGLNDLEKQIELTHDNVRYAMEEVGSSMNNVIHTFHFLKVPEVRRMWRAELDYYEKHARSLIEEGPPASTFMQLPSLSSSTHLAEIEIIGAVTRDKPNWEVKRYNWFYGDAKLYYSEFNTVGNLIIASGMTGQNNYTGKIETSVLEEQVLSAFDKINFLMKEAGSSMDNILKQIVLIPDMQALPRAQLVQREYYQKHAPRLIEEPPVTTIIQPSMLAWPDFQFEIITIGVIPKCIS